MGERAHGQMGWLRRVARSSFPLVEKLSGENFSVWSRLRPRTVQTRFALPLHDFHFRPLVPCGVAGRWAYLPRISITDRDDIVEKEARPNLFGRRILFTGEGYLG